MCDLSHLEGVKHIKHLVLRECTQLQALFGVKELKRLRSLDLSRHLPELLGVIELRALTRLEQLWPCALWKFVPRLSAKLTRFE